MSGPETRFRNGKVSPFLRTLPNTVAFPIQQKSISGDPDYILCCRGKFISLELKAIGGRLSPIQIHKLNNVRDRGKGLTFVADPENWAQVKEDLTTIDRGGKYDQIDVRQSFDE